MTEASREDLLHMRRALHLARRGRGRTRPNPMVGAVIVRGGRVIAEGHHRVLGGPHAEVEALRAAGDGARGATVYVTLEPCSHFGRTPPCADALIAAGVERVVAAMLDPNPRVAGRGVERLRAAGIHVDLGVLEAEARALNFGFISLITTGRPFVTLKLAATLDGRIATSSGESKWVTGPAARRRVQTMRARHDAVGVGVGTVIADDPMLNVRTASGRPRRRQPLRVVFDGALRTPESSRLFSEPGGGEVFIVAGQSADEAREKRLVGLGANVIRVSEGEGEGIVAPRPALEAVGRAGVTSLFVEGGSVFGTALLRAGVVDELALFFAPKLLGDGVPAVGDLGVTRMADVLRIEDMRVDRVGDDLLVRGRPLPGRLGPRAVVD